ncbi:MAG: 1-deoxy-D-xylulose-5-phosphate reductoisomerase [Clostridia bacterium]
MKKIVIIGSTGSIGTQTLNVVRRHNDKFQVVGLVANSNVELLIKQKEEFGVENCGLFLNSTGVAANGLVYGKECYDIAKLPEADIILVAASGISALPYVVNAIKAKKSIALANKETLVCAGELIMPMVKNSGIDLLPVDSEHSAIWQCLRGGQRKDVKKLILTASGGSFLRTPIEDLKDVTVENALKHPNWNMGKKITIDSATMFNKGLEIIEAKWLFDMDIDDINVVIHPESIVHSMVEFADSSVIAQLSYPTMEIPIQLALTYPDRLNSAVSSLDFAKIGQLHFEQLDKVKYPSVDLCVKASKEGGFYPTILNASNEILVDRFIKGQIKYLDIFDKTVAILEKRWEKMPLNLDNIQYISDKAMNLAREI